jgi:sulfatase maturation enzyme AslB (radical SAM superfamily)
VAEFNGDLQNILNLPIYDQLRNDSINGIKNPSCQKCYYEEEMGKFSLRQEFNSTNTSEKVELKFLEIGFDNICNLTCDGCWGEFSSSWANKENPTVSKRAHVLDTSEITTVPESIEKVTFLGGEPLMTNRHARFLNKIKNLFQISATYNTNGTFLLSENEIKILKKLKDVHFIVSIDGYKELNDQIRSGSSWYQITEFLNQLINCKFNFSIHTVIHRNNYEGIFELEEWIRNNRFKWTTNILTYPKHLDISCLDINLISSFLEKLKVSSIPNKEYILEHLYG